MGYRTRGRRRDLRLSTPEFGDIVWIDFDPQVGHEQAKRRPGLVLSHREFNQMFGVAFVCPISTKGKGHAFEVPLPPSFPVKGSVLVRHMKSLDWRMRRADRICVAPIAITQRAAEI